MGRKDLRISEDIRGGMVIKMLKRNVARMVSFSVCLGLCLSAVGCGRTKVQYEGGRKAPSTGQPGSQQDSGTEQETDDVTKYPLAKQLGVSEQEYDDQVQGVKSPQTVSARIQLPKASELATVSVKEHYLTPKDKKKICNYFFEEGTTEVNTAMVPSRERYHRELQLLEKNQEDLEFYYPNQYAKEYGRKRKLYDKAQSMDKISRDPENYHQNAYLGMLGNTYATLCFESDSQRKINEWTLKVVDATGYVHRKPDPDPDDAKAYQYTINGHELETYVNWEYQGDGRYDWNAEDQSRENKCVMSQQEAVEQAEKICQDLSMDDLVTSDVSELEFHILGKNLSVHYEKNGYVVTLARQIRGAAASTAFWRKYSGDQDIANYSHGGVYPGEMVRIALNDRGIVEITCQGMMERIAEKQVQSILQLEQVKQVLRERLEQSRETADTEWKCLMLEYLRLKEKDNDGYLYVPVWTLANEEDEYGIHGKMRNLGRSICVNALDGSVIDLDRQALVVKSTLYDLYEEEAMRDNGYTNEDEKSQNIRMYEW